MTLFGTIGMATLIIGHPNFFIGNQDQITMKNRKYFVFAGLDGSGKSTAVLQVAQRLTQDGLNVVTVREPGSTNLGEELRSLIKRYGSSLRPIQLAMLMNTARLHLVNEKIIPALRDDAIILSDRGAACTYAYQNYHAHNRYGIIKNIDNFPIASSIADQIHELNHIGTAYSDVSPLHTFWLTGPPSEFGQRAGNAYFTDMDAKKLQHIHYAYRYYFQNNYGGEHTEIDSFRNGTDAVANIAYNQIMEVIN